MILLCCFLIKHGRCLVTRLDAASEVVEVPKIKLAVRMTLLCRSFVKLHRLRVVLGHLTLIVHCPQIEECVYITCIPRRP